MNKIAMLDRKTSKKNAYVKKIYKGISDTNNI